MIGVCARARAFCLLVCQSVAAVEQLLSGEPVLGHIAGLAADQVVRHGALLLLLDLLNSFTISNTKLLATTFRLLRPGLRRTLLLPPHHRRRFPAQ